ncbi:MAG: hypothetical protein ACRELS_21350 [Candidatus Rokuibacteriota bacterium]
MIRRAGLVVGVLLAAASLGGAPAAGQPVRVGQPAPDIAGAPWINSPPLTMEALRGRVVLVEFWTYG